MKLFKKILLFKIKPSGGYGFICGCGIGMIVNYLLGYVTPELSMFFVLETIYISARLELEL